MLGRDRGRSAGGASPVGSVARARSRSGGPEPTQPEAPATVERASPGLAALFGALRADGRHSFLDLGAASAANLNVCGRFASQIRFAGGSPHPSAVAAEEAAAASLPPNVDRPYDVVLAWDTLDWLDEPGRRTLVERVVDITAASARLYLVVDASTTPTRRRTRATLLDTDRVAQRPVGPEEPRGRPLLPAQVEQLIAPFEVQHAYSLRTGLREYVAIRR